MKRFAELFDALDATTATSEKAGGAGSYFAATPASDAARPFTLHWRQTATNRPALKRSFALGATGRRAAGLAVRGVPSGGGDLAETIALVLPDALPIASADADRLPESGLATWITERLLPLRTMDETMRRQRCCGLASL